MTAAHDAQVPDPLARPTTEENITSDRSQQPRSSGELVLQRGGNEFQDKTKKPEEQRAKAEVQGELDPATQKDSPVTKAVIIVTHYNSVIGVHRFRRHFCNAATDGDRSLVNNLGDYNFEQAGTAAAVKEIEQQAEAAAAATKIEQVEIAAAPASQAGGNSSSPKGGHGGWGRERPPQRGRGGRGIVRHD